MKQESEGRYRDGRIITSLKDLLNSSVALYADRPAFLIKQKKGGDYHSISYQQLKNDVDALGTKLLELGLGDKKIALIGENCYEWMVTYFAVVNGTGIVVPLDKELNREEVLHILDRTKCHAVFYTKKYADYFRDADVDIKVLMKVYGEQTILSQQLSVVDSLVRRKTKNAFVWEELVDSGEQLITSGERKFLDVEIDSEAMNILLFTSGTTGMAKGVMLCHRNLVTSIMDTSKIAYVTKEDRTLSILPIHHTFESTLGVMFVLYRGASIAFSEGLKYLTKNLVEAEATVLIGVPLIFESIYDKLWKQAEKSGKANKLRRGIRLNKTLQAFGVDKSRTLFRSVHEKFGGKLRLVISGAAGIDPKVLRGFDDLGLRMLQGYGLTECSPLVAGTPEFRNTYKKAGSVGVSVESGEIKIVNPDEDGIGEVIFRGPSVMLGYYQMPEATAEVIRDGWFYTGDLGFLDREGWLYLTGRKKNVIVTKTGKNIYPEEVEIYLNENKYVQESLVHGVAEDDGEDLRVSAQIRPDYEIIYEEFGEDFPEEEVHALIKKVVGEINEKLPVYKRVRGFTLRKEDFVKTTTKKIQRHKNI